MDLSGSVGGDTDEDDDAPHNPASDALFSPDALQALTLEEAERSQYLDFLETVPLLKVLGHEDLQKGDCAAQSFLVPAFLPRCRLRGVLLSFRVTETVQDMFMTPLYQQHASHTLASRAYGPQPHTRSSSAPGPYMYTAAIPRST